MEVDVSKISYIILCFYTGFMYMCALHIDEWLSYEKSGSIWAFQAIPILLANPL